MGRLSIRLTETLCPNSSPHSAIAQPRHGALLPAILVPFSGATDTGTIPRFAPEDTRAVGATPRILQPLALVEPRRECPEASRSLYATKSAQPAFATQPS